MQIKNAIKNAIEILQHAHIDSLQAQQDALLLLSALLQRDRAYLLAFPERQLDNIITQKFQQWVQRRATGEPIAYLLQQREFWSLSLQVTPDVLIPRHETELLVELVLNIIPMHQVSDIIDLGTGSGAIALAIAKERPQARITALDVSQKALQVAQRNAVALNIHHVSFCHSHWWQSVSPSQQFHVIVSNPPYIAEGDEHVQQGDCRFEPRQALTSGIDGLDAIREIVAHALAHLYMEGYLLIEHGYDQSAAVYQLLQEAGFTEINTHKDYAEQARVTLGRKSTF